MPQLLRHKDRLVVAMVSAALLSALALVALPNLASAGKESPLVRAGVSPRDAQQAKKLGRAKREQPSCPQPCKVQGSITGFEVKAQGSRQNMFRTHELGKLVAWGVQLSKPDPDQRVGAGDLFSSKRFGKGPTARLSVIKRTKGNKYKLLRQSPVVKLNPFYGQSPIFTLNDPMRVPKGAVVALTTPTWLPNLVVSSQTKNSVWKASRSGKDDQCASERASKNTVPAMRVGKERSFGCAFSDRILYSAYYVPKKKKKQDATEVKTLGDRNAPAYHPGAAGGSGGVTLP